MSKTLIQTKEGEKKTTPVTTKILQLLFKHATVKIRLIIGTLKQM